MKKLLLKGFILGASLIMLSGFVSSVDAMGLLPGGGGHGGGHHGGGHHGGGGGRPTPVPEPSTLALLGAGAAGAGAYLIAKIRKKK